MALLILHCVSDNLLCGCDLSSRPLLDQEARLTASYLWRAESRPDEYSLLLFPQDFTTRWFKYVHKSWGMGDQVRQRNRIKHWFPCFAADLQGTRRTTTSSSFLLCKPVSNSSSSLLNWASWTK